MKAVQAIEVDDTLVSLPTDAALRVIPRMSCPFPELCEVEMWKSSPWWFKMALLLVNERKQGSSSRLAAYVSSLPEELDTPLHWTEKDLEELQVRGSGSEGFA